MAKPRKKKRQSNGKRQIETALPKRKYKRTNRLLYIFSGILLVVFGGGAALMGGGAPPPPPDQVTPAPAVEPAPPASGAADQFTATPTEVPASLDPTQIPATPTPAP